MVKWWFSIVMLVYQRVPCKHFPVRLSEFAPNRQSPPVSHDKSHFLSATLANVLHIRQTLVPAAQNININISSVHQNLGARVKRLYTPNWSKLNLTTTNTINTHGPLADLVVTPCDTSSARVYAQVVIKKYGKTSKQISSRASHVAINPTTILTPLTQLCHYTPRRIGCSQCALPCCYLLKLYIYMCVCAYVRACVCKTICSYVFCFLSLSLCVSLSLSLCLSLSLSLFITLAMYLSDIIYIYISLSLSAYLLLYIIYIYVYIYVIIVHIIYIYNV